MNSQPAAQSSVTVNTNSYLSISLSWTPSQTIATMSSTAAAAEPYFSVSTIKIKPGKASEVQACLAEVAKDTLENEPGAKIYRFYKVEGRDEFVCVEKFASRDAYKIHTSSDHVRRWAEKYLFSDAGLFEGTFEFHPLTSEDGFSAGGFDRE
jgi:quinol monooxygenase YgiN